MKNGIRVAICVMLVVAVLAMSLSVFADNEPTVTPYPGTEDNPLLNANIDQIAFIIWQLLQSWGIDINYGEITPYTTDIQNTIINWLWEFLDEQPSVESVLAWTLDWWFGTDFFGNFVVNDSLLEDVESFADWLIVKFGLQDNENKPVDVIYAIDNIRLYKIGDVYPSYHIVGTDNLDWPQYVTVNLTGSYPPDVRNVYYFIWETQNAYGANRYDVVLVTDDIPQTNDSVVFRSQCLDRNGNPQATSVLYANFYDLNNTYGEIRGVYGRSAEFAWDSYNQWIPAGADIFLGSEDDLKNFLRNAEINGAGTYISTREIILPDDDPNYVSGDGLTIVEGEPIYSVIEIPDTITVDNLPAVISQGTVNNPGLETFWGFIPVLAEQTKDAIILTRGLIYELPEELVVTFYAVMGGLILFGIIKLMREH